MTADGRAGTAAAARSGVPNGHPIVLDRVRVAYPGSASAALDGVSLRIPAGQHVCILGGNGSGKSTLLRLVNVLALPTEGEVRICGMDTGDPGLALAIRSRTASVFQNPEDQMVTCVVADDVAFGPENLRVAQPEIARRVDASLSSVDMAAFSDSDPCDLSGGQTQRVAIAGALAMDPEIMLLDEPCAMLDAEGRADVRRIVSGLGGRGITVLHVTHFMEDAARADRVIVLDKGRVAFDGPPGSLFSRPDLVCRLGLEMPREEPRGVHIGELDAAGGGTAPGVRPAIEFEKVSFSYAEQEDPRRGARWAGLFGRRRATSRERTTRGPLALDSLSFRAYPGTLTALIGRTGSGKSTTAELACALKLPTDGAVRIAGVDTSDLARRRELRRRVGFVAQLPERQLFAETVFDDVAFGPTNLGMAPDEIGRRVREALAAVNLDPTDDLLRASPFALSGGQQRGVALAGVLAMGQPVLVLDEPMAGLDPVGRAQLRRLLRSLKRKGVALLMVTHSMEDVAELADQVVALDRGRRVGQSALRPLDVEDGKGGADGPAR